MNLNQPTRQPPTEPGDWEFCRDRESKTYRLQVYPVRDTFWCRNHNTNINCDVRTMPPGYWRKSEPLEPFAPQLPVVELWGEYVIVETSDSVHVVSEYGYVWSGKRGDLKRALPTAERTHVCRWVPGVVREKTSTRVPTQQDNSSGLHQRYRVAKADGTPCDPGAVYFVLRLDDGGDDKKHIDACRAAAAHYASCVESVPRLAQLSKELLALLVEFEKGKI